jgi:hypothetical protein
MPATTSSVPIAGSISPADESPQIVLVERLGGHDTFLSGVLQLGQRRIAVRIITLDDVTVLRPVDAKGFAHLAGTCMGTLHLPHGSRRRGVPADLEAAAIRRQRTLGQLDDAELRYALTFLEEATTARIRQARIDTIVAALPESAAPASQRAVAAPPSRQVPASVD